MQISFEFSLSPQAIGVLVGSVVVSTTAVRWFWKRRRIRFELDEESSEISGRADWHA